MSPSHWNLLKRYAQSYTAEWRRHKKNPDWIILVGDYLWRFDLASIKRNKIVDALMGKN